MERILFELRHSGRAIGTTPGYIVGHFCVYKIHHWHVAHLQTHIRLHADFARRKDAVAVAEAMDGDLWAFETEPDQDLVDKLWASWTSAIRNLCINEQGVLRKKDVTDTAQEKTAE